MSIFYSALTRSFYDTDFNDHIPSDAVEISVDEHVKLLQGQSNGKVIVSDKNNFPTLEEPQKLFAEELIKTQIILLENSITPRRIREAVLGIDNGWLNAVNSEITNLRNSLTSFEKNAI